MAFGLTIGTERATALQNAIQDELIKRGFSPDADPVMAEYITIMIINNKTPPQISSELEDLIGSDFDASFVDWLFAEAAKGAPESENPAPVELPSSQQSVRDVPPHISLDTQRRPPSILRATAPIYQSAISQALPSTSPTAQKRTASARSPSPTGPPSKSRRTDLPTGPRAMRDGPGSHVPGGHPRSLLDRVGPARGNHAPHYNAPHDDVQARIDSITNGSADPSMMMMSGGFPMNGMSGMDMTAMGMANPMMLQELMMNQMAMMSQIAGAMGIMPQAPFMNGGMPMQPGMGGDMGGFGGVPSGALHGGLDGNRGRGRGRGGAGRGAGRGRGGHGGHHSSEGPTSNGVPPVSPASQPPTLAVVAASAPAVAAPIPIAASTSTGSVRSTFVPPDRPQSPTLCKFSLKCTNPLCRYSHPSPVATPESGVVLSNDACEKGKDCKDKDCIKAHISPAVLNNLNAEVPKPNTLTPPAPPPQQNTVPCRYGAACTRVGCTFSHPARQPAPHFTQQCRFGTACTRAACSFQHPEGRVLPSTFHRGLGATGGLVNVPTPETGSIGAPSPHKSMSFKKAEGAGDEAAKTSVPAASRAADLEKRVKEMEERKNEAQKAIAAAQAGKKDDASKAVPISA
ncbi:hypothetical protein BC628DRAFT_1317663 [Trametes gibbosa]|uniref:Nuclear polyadenylated RNA-binding protein NAB2 n=1 Tax=Trametes gibbosa TaxID=160864 RepID=A0A6G6FQK9_9APHY|nr:hypothetical protein BC628DRAFT_1317663 [Trametes gibbosa]QIE48524.1 hypothetical protein [Trametes gibbosa]